MPKIILPEMVKCWKCSDHVVCNGCGKELETVGEIHEILNDAGDRFPEKCGEGVNWPDPDCDCEDGYRYDFDDLAAAVDNAGLTWRADSNVGKVGGGRFAQFAIYKYKPDRPKWENPVGELILGYVRRTPTEAAIAAINKVNREAEGE